MKSTFHPTYTRRFFRVPTALGLLVGLLWAPVLRAQSPEEHASHHPGQAADAMPASGSSVMPVTSPGVARGVMDGMGEMMNEMGKAPPKELYPSLMALPELSPEQRKQVEEQAAARMHAGVALMSQSLDTLNAGAQVGDYFTMHEAMTRLREGAAQLESGIAARRALVEGRAPRNVALTWFKREMNLASPIPRDEARVYLGVTPFHLFTMGLLVAFALAMVVMYFLKMRRAAALFGRLEPGSGPPPPGASPPLAGAPVPFWPGTPPVGLNSPPGGSPSIPVPGGGVGNASDNPLGSPLSKSTSASSAASPTISEATSASPVTASWRGRLRVRSIVTETPTVKTFRLVPSTGDRFLPFTFVPGQFLNVAFGIGGARMNRSYSISSSPTQREYLDLTVRREPRGAVSRHINDLLKAGDPIEAAGPVGRFTFTGTEADSIVLIAGGVGITPMMCVMRYLTERSWPGDIFFVYACRAPNDFMFANEVAALQQANLKLHVAVTMSRPEGTNWNGPRGHLTKELLSQMIPNLASRRIHLCGPPSMMDSTKDLLRELGVPPDQVQTELFGAAKPTPAAAGTTVKPTARATGPTVTFSKNNKLARVRVGQTILELSEELGVGIENSCRVGTCGVCKVKMTSGEVEMAVEDALDPDDKANGIILACQAKPKDDVAVEA